MRITNKGEGNPRKCVQQTNPPPKKTLDPKVLEVMEEANKSNYARKFCTVACRMKTSF